LDKIRQCLKHYASPPPDSGFTRGAIRRAVFPIVCADHCVHLLGMDLAEVVQDGRKLAEVLEYGYQLYKYDMVLVFSDPYVEAQALGCPVKFSPAPTLLGPKSNQAIDRTDEIIKAAEILKQKVDVPVFVSIKGPFSLGSFLIGMESFLKDLIAAPKKAEAVINRALKFQIGYLERLLSIGANIFIGDPVASSSVLSPKLFERFAFKSLQILIKKIKENRLIAGVHVCGETKPIIQLLDELGADILSIEDITPKTRTLKMGGVSTDTILTGDKTKIKSEIRQAFNEPYLILATSCDVPTTTDSKNIKLMMEMAHVQNND
jgi:uroporphyrinogen decarboxylase